MVSGRAGQGAEIDVPSDSVFHASDRAETVPVVGDIGAGVDQGAGRGAQLAPAAAPVTSGHGDRAAAGGRGSCRGRFPPSRLCRWRDRLGWFAGDRTQQRP
jgi:hypothetical protein